MNDYFDSKARIDALLTEAALWRGTPFHHHGRARGVGVDCVGLPLCIYQNVGVIGDVSIPTYSMDGGSHLHDSALIGVLIRTRKFRKVDSGERGLTGDLLVMKLGRVEHHLGLSLYGTQFIHAIKGHGVIECDASDPTYFNRIMSAYRPLEL